MYAPIRSLRFEEISNFLKAFVFLRCSALKRIEIIICALSSLKKLVDLFVYSIKMKSAQIRAIFFFLLFSFHRMLMKVLQKVARKAEKVTYNNGIGWEAFSRSTTTMCVQKHLVFKHLVFLKDTSEFYCRFRSSQLSTIKYIYPASA